MNGHGSTHDDVRWCDSSTPTLQDDAIPGAFIMTMRTRQQVRIALRLILATLVTVLFLFPIYWLFIISFKTPDEIYSYPPKWYPGRFHFGTYAVLFQDGDADTVWHSLFIASSSTLLAIFL